MSTDRIELKGIAVEALVGVFEEERRAMRPLNIDVVLRCDLRDASKSDRLEDTVDYFGLTDRIRAVCAESSHYLIERLAGDIATLCLSEPLVASVEVTLHKPGAVRGVADIAVVLDRARPPAR